MINFPIRTVIYLIYLVASFVSRHLPPKGKAYLEKIKFWKSINLLKNLIL